ncbi:phage tail protein [Virgisporangium aliadipatigenens]|uniref:phage tail protein n=1 Tax=Virgisporangium aliadipatigenens TaxID=741659 RepID=UPI001942BAF0|nr:hypothetical protein [Virgisporangium aliadipatigenens]
MTSPGGVEAARLSVRVLPDTSKFAAELLRFLRRIEQHVELTLRAAVDLPSLLSSVRHAITAARRLPVRLPAQLDTAGLAAAVRRAAASAEDGVAVRVGVELNTARLAAHVRAAVATRSGRVRLEPDMAHFARELWHWIQQLEDRFTLFLRVEPDIVNLLSSLRAAADIARRTVVVQLRTDLDPTVLIAQTRAAAALASRTAGSIRVPVDIDTSRIAAGLRRIGGAVAGAASRGAGLLASGVKVGLIAAGLGAAVVQAANLAAALAPAAGALAAIPALAAVAGGAVAALKIGFAGVGDAIGGNVDALGRLAPAARAVVDEVRGLAPQFDALRRVVQESLFGPLIGEARALAEVWLPLLETRLSGISGAFSAMFARAGEGARTPEFLAGIDAALRATQAGVAAFAAVTGPLVRALGVVIGAFAPALGRAAEAAAALAGSFAQFLLNADRTGELAGFVSTVGTTLRQIGTVLVQLGGIFAGVMSAAQTSGGGLLATLGQILTSVNAFVSVGPGRDALAGLFGAAQAAVSALLPIVLDLVAAIGPALADLLGPGGLAGGLAALAPAAKPVGAALAGIGRAVAPLLGLLGSVLADALTYLGTLLSMLAAEFGPLIAVFAKAGTALAQGLLPVLMTALETGLPAAVAVGEALATALGPIVPVVGELVTAFVQNLLPALTQLQGVMSSELLPVLTEAATQVGGALVQALRDLAPIMPDLANAAAGLATAVVQVGVALLPLLPILAEIIARLVGSGALTVAVESLTGVVIIAAAIIGALSNALRVVVGWLVQAWDWSQRTSAAMEAGFGAAVSYIASLPGTIRGFFAGAGGWLVDAGRNLVDGLLNGIRQMAARAIQAARDVATSMVNAAKSALGIRSPSTVFAGIGENVVAGFVAGIDSARPAAAGAIDRLVTVPCPPTVEPDGGTDPVVNLTALVRIGDGPVLDAVETAVSRDPERFAQHVRAGERSLTRRG